MIIKLFIKIIIELLIKIRGRVTSGSPDSVYGGRDTSHLASLPRRWLHACQGTVAAYTGRGPRLATRPSLQITSPSLYSEGGPWSILPGPWPRLPVSLPTARITITAQQEEYKQPETNNNKDVYKRLEFFNDEIYDNFGDWLCLNMIFINEKFYLNVLDSYCQN